MGEGTAPGAAGMPRVAADTGGTGWTGGWGGGAGAGGAVTGSGRGLGKICFNRLFL
jgi:hypothetical protein